MSDSEHASLVRRVRWSDSDTIVHEIERLSIAQVVGCGWVQTRDLCNREFWKPQTEGGCGGQWAMLMKLVDQIDEPDYCAVGNIWAAICERNRPGSSNMLRPGEQKLLLKAACNSATKPVSHVRHRRSHVDVKANSR